MVDDRFYTAGVVGSSPTVPTKNFGGSDLISFGVVVQLVRTLACHARGRGFESRQLRFTK